MTNLEDNWGAVLVVPQPERRGVPWEDPELPAWLGFYRTLRDLLLRPGEFFENLGTGRGAEPLAFALIISTAGLLGALFWNLLILIGGTSLGDTAGLASYVSMGPEALIGLMVLTPLLVLADLGLGGLCWWGSLALTDASREFTPGWRVFCYAQGGLVLAFIPFFGTPLAGIWVLALMYIGARQGFGLSALSSLGVLILFLVFEAVLGMIVLLGLIVSLAGLAGLGFLALLG